MMRFSSLTLAAVLAAAMFATSLKPAEAGRRDRVLLGIAAGVVGAAIVSQRYHRPRYRHYGYHYPRYRVRDRHYRRYYRRHYDRPYYYADRNFAPYSYRAHRLYRDRSGRGSSPESETR